jgi:hypothetical protein
VLRDAARREPFSPVDADADADVDADVDADDRIVIVIARDPCRTVRRGAVRSSACADVARHTRQWVFTTPRRAAPHTRVLWKARPSRGYTSLFTHVLEV